MAARREDGLHTQVSAANPEELQLSVCLLLLGLCQAYSARAISTKPAMFVLFNPITLQALRTAGASDALVSTVNELSELNTLEEHMPGEIPPVLERARAVAEAEVSRLAVHGRQIRNWIYEVDAIAEEAPEN